MAILDGELVLSSAQAITTTADSTNVIDRGTLGALGKDLVLVVRVTNDADFAAGGAATLQVTLADSADNNTFADVLLSPALALASLTKKSLVLRVKLPKRLRQYIKLTYTVATGPMTGGKVNAHLLVDAEKRAQ